MICEECNTREATCQVNVIIGEERITRHLCNDCMQRMHGTMGAALFTSKISDMLSSILSAITTETGAEEKEKKEEGPDKFCPVCGASLHAFRKSGRLGCPACYQAFREELTPMLQKIHGRVQHAGRCPLEGEAEQQVRTRKEELSRQMEEAVREEDFERAARIRDEIRELKGEATVCRT
ncbi:MAG: UvrB/UvrC motif-containing protein [Clostridia bacterium]|nr:UvrB/UvrC motif-containing protein [Clostridia bacterium]